MGPPLHFQRSRISCSIPKEMLRSPHLSGRAAHVERARENLFPSAIKRVYRDNKAVRCVVVNILLADERSSELELACHGERKYSRAHRTRRCPRRKEGTLRPACETSGREVCSLSQYKRGGAARAWPTPWHRFSCRGKVGSTVGSGLKWKILEFN